MNRSELEKIFEKHHYGHDVYSRDDIIDELLSLQIKGSKETTIDDVFKE